MLSTQAMVISTFTHREMRPDILDQRYGSDQEPYRDFDLSYTGMWPPGRGNQHDNNFVIPATQNNLYNQVIPALQKGWLVTVYSFEQTRVDPMWGTGGHEELIYGVNEQGNLLVYDPWDVPDPHHPGKPDPDSPNDSARHSLQAWPPSAFIRPKMGFDIIHPKGA